MAEVTTTVVTPENITLLGALVTAIGSLWAYLLKIQSDHKTIVKEKDQKIENLTEKFIDVTKEQVKIGEQMKNATETAVEVMRDNKQLTQKVYDALIERKSL